MRYLIPLFLILSILGCTPPKAAEEAPPTPPPAQDLQGEFKVIGDIPEFMLCGSGKRYRVTGAAADSISRVYVSLRTRPGQPMKAWISGTVDVEASAAGPDSVMRVDALQHLAFDLRCEPIPDPSIIGRYSVELVASARMKRTVVLDLFDDGLVTMYTDLHNGDPVIEEDGIWGRDSEGGVVVKWPRRDHVMQYAYQAGKLIFISTEQGAPSFEMERIGDAIASYGTVGVVTDFLVSTAASSGRTLDPAMIHRNTPLADLFPTAAAKDSLDTAVRTSLGLTEEQMAREWMPVTTVKDVIMIFRHNQTSRK